MSTDTTGTEQPATSSPGPFDNVVALPGHEDALKRAIEKFDAPPVEGKSKVDSILEYWPGKARILVGVIVGLDGSVNLISSTESPALDYHLADVGARMARECLGQHAISHHQLGASPQSA